MTTLVGEAVSPVLVSPWPLVSSTSGRVAEVVPTDPEPGSPGAVYVPPPRHGVRVQAVVSRAISREVVGELTTAVVEDWDDDVELLVAVSASVRCSSWDPLFEQMADRTWTGSDGQPKYQWGSGKKFIITIYVDGSAVWSGVFRKPIDISGDEVVLPCSGSNEVLLERFVGRAEQTDLYDGAGDFERYPLGSTPPGLRFSNPDMTAVVVFDAVRGKRCLQVEGSGWVHFPKVPLAGQNGVGRTAEGSAFGKFPINIPLGKQVVRTYTQRADSLAPSNIGLSEGPKAGGRPDCGSKFSDAPIASTAVMSPSNITHNTWVAVRGFVDPTRYDIVALRQGILTGFLEDADLARYVVKILRDLNSHSIGGSNTGLTARIENLTGVLDQITWNHNTRPAASEMLRSVMERDGGPECRITPAWVLIVTDQLGRDRDELALTMDQVLDPGWSHDPGAQIEDYIVDTGIGTGTSRLAITVSQPFDADAHRISLQVPAPANMGLNTTARWADRHARVAARQQITLQVKVPWDIARQYARGDRVWACLEAGSQIMVGWFRLLNLRWLPESMTAVLSLGLAGA